MHPTIPDTQYEIKSQKAVDVGLTFHMVRSYHKRHWNKLVLAAATVTFMNPCSRSSKVKTWNCICRVGKYDFGSVEALCQEIFEIDKEPLHSALRL
jgi:hypothetical protein